MVFVTDEIALPTSAEGTGRIVCDILALRASVDGIVPVVIELKTERQLTRLVEQVTDYAALVDEHADRFAELRSATFSAPAGVVNPCEKSIVWPMAGTDRDPREDDLAGHQRHHPRHRERRQRAPGDPLRDRHPAQRLSRLYPRTTV